MARDAETQARAGTFSNAAVALVQLMAVVRPQEGPTMSRLERAIAIAAEAHAGQVDKAGAAYILHPLRVMLRMRTASERIAAVLHDVVEDTPWTLEALAGEGFAPEVLAAV